MIKYFWLKRRRETECPNWDTALALVKQHGGRVVAKVVANVAQAVALPEGPSKQVSRLIESQCNRISPVYERARGRHHKSTGWSAVRRMYVRTGVKLPSDCE